MEPPCSFSPSLSPATSALIRAIRFSPSYKRCQTQCPWKSLVQVQLTSCRILKPEDLGTSACTSQLGIFWVILRSLVDVQ